MEKRQTRDGSSRLSDDDSCRLAKKARYSPTKSSCVVHLCNISPAASEVELSLTGLAFGNIVNMIVLRTKNQAFMQFECVREAEAMVDFFEDIRGFLYDRQLYVRFSNHTELDASKNAHTHRSTLDCLSAAKKLRNMATRGSPNSVLHVSISRVLYPVNMNIIYQVFNKFGTILKILFFKKNDKPQAFVQMKDSTSAKLAALSLNRQYIYNGACMMEISFSKLNALTVRYNNDKSRDFTDPTLPASDKQAEPINLSAGFTLMEAASGLQALSSQLYSFPIPSLNPAYLQSAYSTMDLSSRSRLERGPVLLVSNLNEEMVTTDALFILFGVYGDVIRVKILFNKKDSALIQFVAPFQAETALRNLDGIKLFGKEMKVSFSKHSSVQLLKDGVEDTGLTKDYSNSSMHRFKKPGSKNFANIYPPCGTLHLSNISDDCTEDYLIDLFNQHGTVKKFRFFEKDHRMALIEMENTEQACIALINTHNHLLSKDTHLRVSFSKARF